jgi:phosphoribosyl 1,2-cyclic phosphodiesterase
MHVLSAPAAGAARGFHPRQHSLRGVGARYPEGAAPGPEIAFGARMKLTFLGTRGYIEAATRLHGRHSALLVTYRRKRVMVDAGQDWLGLLDAVAPDAIVLTHAHPDHAFGLAKGAPCPVWATADTWKHIDAYPLPERRTVEHRRPAKVEGIGFEAFPVEHSVTFPTVGYRITAGKAAIFYSPDVIYIREREAALRGIRAYVGDGASLTIPMVRRRGDALIGHTRVATQIGWCAKEAVPRCIITHCGVQVVGPDEVRVADEIVALGTARGVPTEVAYDGMEVTLR